jgi:hypothetical protein
MAIQHRIATIGFGMGLVASLVGGSARAQSCEDNCNNLVKVVSQTCTQYDHGDKLEDVLARDEAVRTNTTEQRDALLTIDRDVYAKREQGYDTGQIVTQTVPKCLRECGGE